MRPSQPRALQRSRAFGVRSSWCPKAKVHIQGELTGAALALNAPNNFAVGEHVEIVIISARLMGEKQTHATCAF
jgi:hypothetical protein